MAFPSGDSIQLRRGISVFPEKYIFVFQEFF